MSKDKPSDSIGDEERITSPPEISGKSPADIAATWLWTKLAKTRAGRLLALGFVAIAVLSWLVNQFEVFDKLRVLVKTSTTYATTDEITCLNEWVLKLAGENSQAAAEQTRAKFLDDYAGFGHKNYLSEPIWKNDVHVVRDPVHPGEWLVVIDMYPGASTRECMDSGKAEMVKILDEMPPDRQRDWNNRIGRMLRPAEPLCYDFAEFEHTNGKILNEGPDVHYQQSLGSCANKIHNLPSFSCPAGR
jgi:hypothetical protein